MNAIICGLDDREEVAPRYAAGRLAGDKLESFEVHMLACSPCRDSVREAAALARVLRRRPKRQVARFAVPAGAAGAAIFAWIVLAPGPLERLGRMETAPSLTSIEVRGDADSAAVFAQRGLVAYHARRYEEAAEWLGRAHAEKAQPGVAFFAGTAHLLADEPDSALAYLGFVIASGNVTYTPESRFYAAKAWLRKNNRDSALVQLRHISGSGAPVGEDARLLMEHITALR